MNAPYKLNIPHPLQGKLVPSKLFVARNGWTSLVKVTINSSHLFILKMNLACRFQTTGLTVKMTTFYLDLNFWMSPEFPSNTGNLTRACAHTIMMNLLCLIGTESEHWGVLPITIHYQNPLPLFWIAALLISSFIVPFCWLCYNLISQSNKILLGFNSQPSPRRVCSCTFSTGRVPPC